MDAEAQQIEDDDVRHVAALAVQGKLPLIHMEVVDDGLALHAAGDEPYPWKATADERNRLRVWVGHGLPIIADVTVHRSGDEGISDEIQHIATGLVLSGLRACAVRDEARRREARHAAGDRQRKLDAVKAAEDAVERAREALDAARDAVDALDARTEAS